MVALSNSHVAIVALFCLLCAMAYVSRFAGISGTAIRKACPISETTATPTAVTAAAAALGARAAHPPQGDSRRYLLPVLDGPASVKYAVVEVGTNILGEFVGTSRKNPAEYYLAIEPLTGERTAEHTCAASYGDRCTVVTGAVGQRRGWLPLRIGADTACSSLLGNGTLCGKHARTIVVPTLTADDVIDMVPPHLYIRLLALDCQGMDFYAASTLRRNRDRVAVLIFECQDLPMGPHRLWLYQDPRIRNCAQIISCIEDTWPGWKFTGCAVNYLNIRENNCHFVNTKHPHHDARLRHPHNRRSHRKVEIAGTCPVDDWNA